MFKKYTINTLLSGMSNLTHINDNVNFSTIDAQKSDVSFNGTLVQGTAIVGSADDKEQGISLKTVCEGVYARVRQFVEMNNHGYDPEQNSGSQRYDPENTLDIMDKNMVNTLIRENVDTREILLILKIYRRLKQMETECLKNKSRHDKYYEYVNEYKGTTEYAKYIRDINLSTFENVGRIGADRGTGHDTEHDTEHDTMYEAMRQIQTPHRVNQE